MFSTIVSESKLPELRAKGIETSKLDDCYFHKEAGRLLAVRGLELAEAKTDQEAAEALSEIYILYENISERIQSLYPKIGSKVIDHYKRNCTEYDNPYLVDNSKPKYLK